MSIFSNGPQLFCGTVLRAARVKIATNGTPNRPITVYSVYQAIYFTNVAAGRRLHTPAYDIQKTTVAMEGTLRNPMQFWTFSNFSPVDCKNAEGLSESVPRLSVICQQTEAFKTKATYV